MLITKNVKEENFKQKDKKIGNQVTKKILRQKGYCSIKVKKCFCFTKRKL